MSALIFLTSSAGLWGLPRWKRKLLQQLFHQPVSPEPFLYLKKYTAVIFPMQFPMKSEHQNHPKDCSSHSIGVWGKWIRQWFAVCYSSRNVLIVLAVKNILKLLGNLFEINLEKPNIFRKPQKKSIFTRKAFALSWKNVDKKNQCWKVLWIKCWLQYRHIMKVIMKLIS